MNTFLNRRAILIVFDKIVNIKALHLRSFSIHQNNQENSDSRLKEKSMLYKKYKSENCQKLCPLRSKHSKDRRKIFGEYSSQVHVKFFAGDVSNPRTISNISPIKNNK